MGTMTLAMMTGPTTMTTKTDALVELGLNLSHVVLARLRFS
jgi:hypothetical protein